jgi:hypothetical protein
MDQQNHSLYVDDGSIFRDKDTIQEVIKELGKTFNVKYLGKLENFVGCKLVEDESKDTIWIHQPKLFKHLEQSRQYKTPTAPIQP